MKRVSMRLLLCSAATLTLAGHAQAQPQAGRSALEEVIVTARKVEERLQEAPVSVTALSGEALEKAQIVRLDQIGRVAPSLAINEQAGFPGSVLIFMRGIGAVDPILTNDSPVGLYIDGVYLGRVVGGLKDLTDIERVEVLRGPQGTLFGRNTPGGAISITTRAPSSEFRVEQTLGLASENELNSVTTLETGEIGPAGLAARFTFRHHDMNGYRRNLNTARSHGDGSDNTEQAYIALRARPGPLTLDLKGDWMYRRGNGPSYHVTYISALAASYFNNSPNLGGDAFRAGIPIQTPDHPLSEYRSWTLGNQAPRAELQTYGVSFTGTWDINDAMQLKSISAYRSMRYWTWGDYSGSGNLLGLTSTCPNTLTPAGVPVNTLLGCGVGITPTVQRVGFSNSVVNGDTQRQGQYSQEFQLTGSAGDFKYVAGLYYFKENVNQVQFGRTHLPLAFLGLAPNVAPFNTVAWQRNNTLIYKGSSKSEAAYAQLSYSPSSILGGKLEVTGGLRYTKDWKTLKQNDSALVRDLKDSFDNLGKLVSVKYQWSRDLMTYVRYSTAYKAGGFSPRAIINGESATSAYKPEIAKAYEVGFKGEFFDRRVRLNGDVFLTDYSNYQVNSQTGVNGRLVTQVFNAGKIRLTGFEAETTFLPAEGWEVNASYGYVKPDIRRFPINLAVPGAVPARTQTFDVADMLEWQDTPKNTASASVQYTLPRFSNGSELALRGDWSYMGSRVFYTGASSLRIGANGQPERIPYTNGLVHPTDAGRTDPYHEFGAQAVLSDLKVGGANLTVIGYVQNITNEKMILGHVDFTTIGMFATAWGRGRVFGLTVKAEYP